MQPHNEPDDSVDAGEAPPTDHAIETHFSWLRTRMSTERTMMSWNRTSLSLISFGFTIYQFFERLQQSTVGEAAVRPEAPRNLGLSLIAVGTLGTFIAIWQYFHFVSYLTSDQFREIGSREGLPRWPLALVVTLFLSAIGLVTMIWVILRG